MTESLEDLGLDPMTHKKASEPLLQEIIKTLNKELKPSRLFLFGSHAQGTATTQSDYDFVAVIPDQRKKQSMDMTEIHDLLWSRFKIQADVFIYTEKQFSAWENEFSSIPETAKNTGQEIDLGSL